MIVYGDLLRVSSSSESYHSRITRITDSLGKQRENRITSVDVVKINGAFSIRSFLGISSRREGINLQRYTVPFSCSRHSAGRPPSRHPLLLPKTAPKLWSSRKALKSLWRSAGMIRSALRCFVFALAAMCKAPRQWRNGISFRLLIHELFSTTMTTMCRS